jgi:hypothetical protein
LDLEFLSDFIAFLGQAQRDSESLVFFSSLKRQKRETAAECWRALGNWITQIEDCINRSEDQRLSEQNLEDNLFDTRNTLDREMDYWKSRVAVFTGLIDGIGHDSTAHIVSVCDRNCSEPEQLSLLDTWRSMVLQVTEICEEVGNVL